MFVTVEGLLWKLMYLKLNHVIFPVVSLPTHFQSSQSIYNLLKIVQVMNFKRMFAADFSYGDQLYRSCPIWAKLHELSSVHCGLGIFSVLLMCH